MPINLAAKYGMQNLLTAIAPGLKRVRSSRHFATAGAGWLEAAEPGAA